MSDEVTPDSLQCKCTEYSKSAASFQVHCFIVVWWIVMAFAISIGYGLMLA